MPLSEVLLSTCLSADTFALPHGRETRVASLPVWWPQRPQTNSSICEIQPPLKLRTRIADDLARGLMWETNFNKEHLAILFHPLDLSDESKAFQLHFFRFQIAVFRVNVFTSSVHEIHSFYLFTFSSYFSSTWTRVACNADVSDLPQLLEETQQQCPVELTVPDNAPHFVQYTL